jgi:hypothetical protein
MSDQFLQYLLRFYRARTTFSDLRHAWFNENPQKLFRDTTIVMFKSILVWNSDYYIERALERKSN